MYKLLTKYTRETYEYVINELLDKDSNIKGYKFIKPNPSKYENKYIANEIYSFFLTHYFKAIDTYVQNELIIKDSVDNKKCINIIDVGANIATVTFAYIDYILNNCENICDININIIFIESDEYRVLLLKKSIDKYVELSNLKINYTILNKFYEDAIEDINLMKFSGNTVILISNLLNWIDKLDVFKSRLENNILNIDNNYKCIAINIETKSNDAYKKLISLYEDMDNQVLLRVKYKNKNMPEFENIPNSYYYDKYGNAKCKLNKQYYYGVILKDNDLYLNRDINYIEKAYYKTLYTCRNYYLYDNIEMKYVGKNLDKVKYYILKLIKDEEFIKNYEYQYKMKKNNNEYRALYLDDFINDIINTTVLITKGLKFDKLQNDTISYGNRLNKDLDSPFTFKLYYDQFFNKYKSKECEYRSMYSYYYKIDLKQFYNNINRNVLMKSENEHNEFGSKYYDRIINKYIDINLYDCKVGYGLPQGPDISNLLANMYLKSYDDWWINNYGCSGIIRYVDDIIIFANNKSECEVRYNESKKYLKEMLDLEIGEKKTEHGVTEENIDNKDEDYYSAILDESCIILRSIYKLDKKNYINFKNNPKKFIEIYRKCLQKLGIYLTKEWLNIKISKEIGFLERLKSKIKTDKKLLSWTSKKNIYDIKLKLGEIPSSILEEEIDIWHKEFIKNNKKFVNRIELITNKLKQKLEIIINDVKMEKVSSKEVKSIFKFTMNKISIFKYSNMNKYIEDIFEYFPYCNKKNMVNYSEINSLIVKYISNKNLKSDLYDYAIYIWLLGEYRNEESLNVLESIFRESYNENKYFINTLATEAILKINNASSELIEYIENNIKEENNYYNIRNMVIILNHFCKYENIYNVLNEIDEYDERVQLFIKWITDNKELDIVEELDDIPEEIKEKYPDYPISNEYISL